MEEEYTVSSPIPEEERIGRLIKGARIRKGFSQKELAAKLCIPPAIIGFWESHKSLPTLLQAEQLAKLLHTVKEHFIIDKEIFENDNFKDEIKIIKDILPKLVLNKYTLNENYTTDQIQKEIDRCLNLINTGVTPKRKKGDVHYHKFTDLKFDYQVTDELDARIKEWSFLFQDNKFYFIFKTKGYYFYWD